MEYQSILDQLVEILAPLAQGHVKVDADTDLVGALNMDSLQVMNLMLSVEDHFDVAVPVNALGDVKTVGDLALQIQKLVNQD
jgi:acyl carrier protein